jgi:uncharacterized protein (DUF58 family)
MLPAETIRQIRRLHLRARRAVEDLLGGEYRSVFKGTGMVFEEVREYQPGDDVRAIDWNVTARMGHAFIKRYVEERELTVLLVVDWSASQRFGSGRQQKRDVAAELAAVLAFSAISNNDRVGLIGFTDQVECFIRPRKGIRHSLRLIREALYFTPKRKGTALGPALQFLNRVFRRRAVVFLISDFLDQQLEKVLFWSGRRHDMVALWINDARETSLPRVGLVEVADAETGRTQVVDTTSVRVREGFARAAARRRESLARLMHGAGVDVVEIPTDGTHFDALVRYFRWREERLRKA